MLVTSFKLQSRDSATFRSRSRFADTLSWICPLHGDWRNVKLLFDNTYSDSIRGASTTRRKEKRRGKSGSCVLSRFAAVIARADILHRCGKPNGIGKTACSISHGRDDDSEHRAGFRGSHFVNPLSRESNP